MCRQNEVMVRGNDMYVEKITIDEANAILLESESHFLDFKSKAVSGKGLQKIVAGFANADSGDVYVGIEDDASAIGLDRWVGFVNEEEANQLIQTIFQEIRPYPPIQCEFYELVDNKAKGLILKINVAKSAEIHETSDGKVYIRRGAQTLPISGVEIVNQKLSKGLISFEDQLIQGYEVAELLESEELSLFLSMYSPKSEPLEFLKKQRLVRKNGESYMPTVGGVLLFADSPSAVLPKKCAVKIARYDTSDHEARRQHLRQAETVEGPIKKQIDLSLNIIQEIIESMQVLGENGFEKPKYPVDAIKEILVNALIHRDYNISDDVIILIFNNRIEIKNPGRLPGHITVDNILDERFARNPTIVRILNKYPDPPNKDIGEGLNTAYQKMREMRLKPPNISIHPNAINVILPHEPLASPEDTIMEYLSSQESINNRTARKLCGIYSENSMKDIFYRLRDASLIERVPSKEGPAACWRLKRSSL